MASERIIGCPHEEGIDYPMGRSCPRCPFWADIDRFTHEPVVVPVPTISVSEVLEALSQDESVPADEVLSAIEGHRNALVDPLLAALDRGIANLEDTSLEEATLFSYALYVLAKWREPRAYPCVIGWLSLPGEAPFEIGGDVVTQDGARILAAVCDGDLTPIKALILNREANEYSRGGAVSALALLAAWAEAPREPILEYFQWLAQEGLERAPGQVWSSLAMECVNIEALAVFPHLRLAYSEGLIDPGFIAPEELDDAEAAPSGRMLEETRDRYPPIDDVADATAWWDRGPYDGDYEDDEGEAWDGGDDGAVEVQAPHRAPPRIGRNDPCPCGSGKKYKKCCGR
ncbi:MAG: DUF1186 domain-containing protein [Vicinamibacterales bacterium]